jgi:hypothetical protein
MTVSCKKKKINKKNKNLLAQQYIVHCIAVRNCDVPVNTKTFGCGIHIPEKRECFSVTR